MALQVREGECMYATKSCFPCRRVQDDCRRPQHCLCQTHVGGFYRISPCMVNDGAHNTVDAQRHVGEPYRVYLVWELMAPTIL